MSYGKNAILLQGGYDVMGRALNDISLFSFLDKSWKKFNMTLLLWSADIVDKKIQKTKQPVTKSMMTIAKRLPDKVETKAK